MSELTTCNYCNLRDIMTRARRNKERVVQMSSSFMGGTDVYVVPRSTDLKAFKKKPDGKFKVAWLMQVTRYCCC